MSLTELLRELEPLTHAARVRRIVELGRTAARDAGMAATLSALAAGGFSERYLALQACGGSRDGAHVLRSLDDPSRTIRGLAVRLVPIVCDDAPAEAALVAASYATRRALIRRLAKRRRRAPIDTILARLAAGGDERLGAAIRFGSPAIAARFIEPAMERADANDWRGLARRHPDLAAAALRRRAEAAARLDTRLLWQANAVLPILAESSPDEALPLVQALARHASLAQLSLQHLAERLVVSLLPVHPAWSAASLATLVRERGQISLSDLQRRLSDADVRRLAPELLPVLRSWETREREGQLLAAAQCLGRRLRVFDELVELLERLLRETRSPWMADRALGIIARQRRERLAALIPGLIREDPSWITRDAVSGYLHRRRQDLLTPFLGQKAYPGRFSTGITRFVLPLSGGFHRWTPAQQATFARALTEVIDDQERDSLAALGAIRQLAALPGVAPTRLIELASARSPRPALRDAALQALGGLDTGDGLPTLLEALHDRRARVAIYALRRSLLEMPVRQALSLLRGVPLEKVTVAKEVVRLLGELPSEEAYRELLALDARDLHRDVRIALLRTFWTHLERPETWEVFQRAAASPDAAIAQSVGRIPADRLTPAAQQRLVALLASLLAYPEPTVRVQVLGRCTVLPVNDPEQALLPRILASLGSSLPDECEVAAAALFTTYSAADAPQIGAAVERLLPHRRALRTVVQALQSALRGSRGRLQPVARAALDSLAHDPLTLNLRVELAVGALPGEELGQLFDALAGHELHDEALMVAVTRSRGRAPARRPTSWRGWKGRSPSRPTPGCAAWRSRRWSRWPATRAAGMRSRWPGCVPTARMPRRWWPPPRSSPYPQGRRHGLDDSLELFHLGALSVRESLGVALGQLQAEGWLSGSQVEQAAWRPGRAHLCRHWSAVSSSARLLSSLVYRDLINR